MKKLLIALKKTNEAQGELIDSLLSIIVNEKSDDPTTPEPPKNKGDTISTDPENWQVQGKILDGEKVVAGLTEIDGLAYLLVQSQRKIDGVWTNVGEVYTYDDMENWKPHEKNPVLAEAMDWAGQENGVPHRVAPRTLIKHNGIYYTYTRDRLGKYPGIRGVGVFSSKDMVNWQGYHDWFTDVERVKSKIPNDFLTDNEYDRCYLKCATVKEDKIYIIVAIVDVEGNNSTFVLKGTDPITFDSFEHVEAPWIENGRIVDNLYWIGEWIQIGRGDPHYRSIALQKGWKPFTAENGFSIDHDGPRETVFPFYYNNKWHLVYDDNKDGRNIHVATQK